MITHFYNVTLGVLEAKYSGEILPEEIIGYIRHIGNNKNYPRSLKLFSDISGAYFRFSPSEISKIVSASNKAIQNYSSFRSALLVSKPKETALSLLYTEMAKNQKYTVAVFSTKEAALKWLFV